MITYEEMLKAIHNGKEFLETPQGFSKSDMNDMAMVMLNDPDCEIKNYIKKGESYNVEVKVPFRMLRDSVYAPVLKDFGVDKAEMSKLDNYKISRAAASTLVDLSLTFVKSYISSRGLGRKLTLPMTSPDEAAQSISFVRVPEETRETTMIVRAEDGSYKTTPTGKKVTTAAHENLKVANRVPAWSKKTEDLKK